MWQTIQTFDTHPVWGLHARSLTDEAADLLAGRSLVACIGSLALIRVSGADAETFLQGQTTCDFRDVAKGRICLGAHCNAKGRVQASFRAVRTGDDFLLIVPTSQAEPTRAALAKYAMFSKATLSIDTGLWPLAILGPDAAQLATSVWGTAPAPGECLQGEAGLIATLDNRTCLALVAAEKAAVLLQQLQAQGAAVAGDNVWWLSQLQSGIGQIVAQQSEQWIPQEFNYDLVQGVNFKKGCYKGQEIVARIHYRGQTKVRGQLITIEEAGAAEPGTRIIDHNGQNIGTLLQSAFVTAHSLLGFAAMKTGVPESESLRLEPNESSRVQLAPMPYAINNE